MWFYARITMEDIGLAFILTICSSKVAGKNHVQDRIRACVPAEAEPLVPSSGCYPLVNFSRPFCQNHGVTLPNYVYLTPSKQIKRNDLGNVDYNGYLKADLAKISLDFHMDISSAKKCVENIIILACHMFFPGCDRTQSVLRKMMVCRESCLELTHSCGQAWNFAETLIQINYPDDIQGYYKMAECEFPYRNAGDSPECWYFNRHANNTDTPLPLELASKSDCLHLNGSNYNGDISVTESGIPCQSWAEQCPHRHTMSITYPELNDAKNYCRNPQNSGKRPWCFTTDRNKRWEYCEIPKCIPVDGGYGNWSLNNTCNVTCGQGFETWSRACNNPEPKYGGRNCSRLGKPVAVKRCPARPCPVNGGYGNWSLSMKCNVSCGNGVELWQRICDNPVPKYGGHNCSELGKSTETRNCSRKPCPINGGYSNWTLSGKCNVSCGNGVEIWQRTCDNPVPRYGGNNCSELGNSTESRNCTRKPCLINCNCGNWKKFSPCNVTCGQGVEIWTRRCDNPPERYSGNCSKHGVNQETRLCNMKICSVHTRTSFEHIGIAVGVLLLIVAAIVCFILIRRWRNRHKENFFVRHHQLLENSGSTTEEVASSSNETGSTNDHENLLSG